MMNTSRLTLGAILTGAFAAALCCIGPLLVALLGIGGAGFFQKFEAARPYTMAVTGLLLAFGFYLAYRPEKACTDGTVCATRPGVKQIGKVSIWLVTLLAAGLMGFPYYSSFLLAGALKSSAPAAAASQSVTSTLKVTGMTCGGCAMSVKKALLALPGVINAEVSSERGEAVVNHDPRLSDAALKDAVVKTGFGIEGEAAPAPVAASASPNAEKLQAIDAARLKSSFNAARDRVRVVSLLSPTCPYCIRGQIVLKNIFSGNDSPRLKGFVVWLPMLAHDNAESAARQSNLWQEPRIFQGWDGEKRVGELFAKTLKLKTTAWDIYLVYPPGVEWKGDQPPVPSFWMHQLEQKVGADPKLMLDEGQLDNAVAELLRKSR